MAKVEYSEDCEADFDEIARYTMEHWGIEQTGRYLDLLTDACTRLAGSPNLGRKAGLRNREVRRFEAAKHVIFYQAQTAGILVARILHRSMLAQKHLQ